jgi:hypothetical protein
MPLPNAMLQQRMREVLYSLKRTYGGTIDIYKLSSSATDVRTGVKTVSKSVTRIQRAIVVPSKRDRTAVQSISQISADKQFVMGGTFDETVRDFIIDRRDCPSLPDLTEDDWIVYRNRKFQVKTIESFEVDAGWVITAKELVGEIPEQFHVLRCDHYLSFADQPTAS